MSRTHNGAPRYSKYFEVIDVEDSTAELIVVHEITCGRFENAPCNCRPESELVLHQPACQRQRGGHCDCAPALEMVPSKDRLQ